MDAHARLPRAASADAVLATMDACGIGRVVLSAGGVVPTEQLARNLRTGSSSTAEPDNAAVLAAARTHPDRIVPFYFGNPHASVEAYRTAGVDFRGLELSPAVHGLRLDDPLARVWVEQAQRFEHPVYTVCTGRPGACVDDLVALARDVPDTTFVLGHAGAGPMDIDGLRAVAPVTNIVVETSCAFYVTVAAALDLLGADRVLFGSEFPHQHPAAELAKVLALDVTPDDLTKILHDNVVRTLRADLTAREPRR